MQLKPILNQFTFKKNLIIKIICSYQTKVSEDQQNGTMVFTKQYYREDFNLKPYPD